MSVMPPAIPGSRELAQRALTRAVRVATVSAWAMLVLGGLSVLVSVTAPLSASFAISIAVVVNGWIELRLSRRLREASQAAPARLAWNQLALGIEIAAYAFWQMRTISAEQVEAALRSPHVAGLLALFDPQVMEEVVALLPPLMRGLYLAVGLGAFLGCLAAGWYYRSQRRWVSMLTPGPAPESPQ